MPGLVEPVKQCVPTAVVRGPCHVCVCSPEGVYHCRPRVCQEEIGGLDRPTRDCEPNVIFRQDNSFCTCSNEGYWMSDACEETFRYLHANNNDPMQNLRTNVACAPNLLYLFDCNVCRCPPTGIVDVTQCTTRYCGEGHKADMCLYGDIIRFENEICSCSDINYFIDRLCVKVQNQVVQTLLADEVRKLDDIGRSWRRLRDLQTDFCDPNVMYNVDCNRCACTDGHLVCTKRICEEVITPSSLREEKLNEVDLPELAQVNGALCEPGKQYRFKCNICSCGFDGHASCTTMVCLEDVVLDEKALRGLLSTG
uniref:Pacifastin domain-containing protein n=1 Tax=Heliothis virescens TaxID=7102 RepID=A0A2A4J4A4_HELVI